ncbi:MAG: 23S rRNA (adenine(2503)-C(2))-methyltransferase RlmN, partial [Gammaproteobacteria bacterium]|nr:23S rRNA (adenine(2503)-C(2))-methyltransferase RlmN [Gammaproteobacteria bacterium]
MPNAELVEFFDELGEKPFRARQLMQWLYQRRVLDFDAMTDLSRSLRAKLHSSACLELPAVLSRENSRDGTQKWLIDVGGGQAVEAVFIPEPNRGTLCISSQAGCAIDCAFCATGRQGFNRNLSATEILAQVLIARDAVPSEITNVVFMGMGEPLANYDNVLRAVQILVDDFGFGLSRRRVTISTSGLAPQLLRLARDCNVALAVSLHATTDALRNQLVPINRVHPIDKLLDACWQYAEVLASRQVTFEYVMLADVNDSAADARRLVSLLRGRPAKVNLIPFNPFPGVDFTCSRADVIDRFTRILRDNGIV